MTIMPLGSGQEVGRSCHLLEFRGTTILLDCGIHPGYEGINGLPFLDNIDTESVDVLLVTHFHLDHVGSLPYFTERTKFKGRIFMTHPTKAVTRLLLGDYIRLTAMKKSSSNKPKDDKDPDVLYTAAELQSCIDKIELIDYHQTISLGRGLKFYALNAGHVLGAAMFMIEIGGRTVLYTGDYSMEEDRHLMAAEVPNVKPDVLMVEATYGVQVHASRAEREARFTGTIESIVTRGGKCLIPVFALGRAQELLLILDEYWQANPHLQQIPIWYASKMANRALRVYQTYANMMNARIRSQMDVGNPFHFSFIQNLKSIDVDSFDDRNPSVVFASPGMLQSGVSRQLFDRWASDPKNGCMIAGYAVEGTLAKDIMNAPKEVTTLEGRRQPLNCLVDYVSFSAHVDFMQNRNFISKVDPKHIVLVHGQKDEMGRLMSALKLQYRQLPKNKQPTVQMPPNLAELKFRFTRRRLAKVMGSLADRETEPKEGEAVDGILVTQNFNSKIVAPKDLSTYTSLRLGSVTSKLHVPFSGKVATLRLFLNEMYKDIEESVDGEGFDNNPCVKFSLSESQVTITTGKTRGVAIVEWKASPVGDIVADSVIALLMHAQSSTASIRLTSQPCSHKRKDETPSDDESGKDKEEGQPEKKRPRTILRIFHDTLLEQFNSVEATFEARKAQFEINSDTRLDSVPLEDGKTLTCNVEVEFEDGNDFDARIKVECSDEKLCKNVQDCLQNLAKSINPV